ncbi:NAD(P)-dependent oxidoreductase [Rhodopseudomonas palustris]|uniref:NAD(P)-dependent oxidoreductase n=1 Tax=Rhodopseudomonas palustris TaxID=1076 RepID=UPI002ACE4551|nr:NAD(P)-dependent oxidoreductase [Rhodopseudomonas palustris]WQH00591.1 NAD(P)-dependent oxidoreductase [Rhodopseudomonas palustris]
MGAPAKVGFIGLGKMGHGMAGRMLDAGFEVAVWNRNPAKADALISRGARRAATPAEAAHAADAIVTMVADDEASQAVWLGADGVATTAKVGAVAIECSTVSHQHALELAAALRARGLIYIDCPVTGLPDAAARGELTLLIGAEPSDLDAARPYLAPLGRTIRHFGPVGAGTVYKLINNLMGAIQIAGIAEGIAMAEQAGLDMALVREAIAGSVVASPQVLRQAPRMIDRDFTNATFTAALRHKDARYAIELAKALRLELPLSLAALASYARATDAAPDDDEAKIVEVVLKPRPRE